MPEVIGSVVILNDVYDEPSIPTGFAVDTETMLMILSKWKCRALELKFLKNLLKLTLLGGISDPRRRVRAIRASGSGKALSNSVDNSKKHTSG